MRLSVTGHRLGYKLGGYDEWVLATPQRVARRMIGQLQPEIVITGMASGTNYTGLTKLTSIEGRNMNKIVINRCGLVTAPVKLRHVLDLFRNPELLIFDGDDDPRQIRFNSAVVSELNKLGRTCSRANNIPDDTFSVIYWDGISTKPSIKDGALVDMLRSIIYIYEGGCATSFVDINNVFICDEHPDVHHIIGRELTSLHFIQDTSTYKLVEVSKEDVYGAGIFHTNPLHINIEFQYSDDFTVLEKVHAKMVHFLSFLSNGEWCGEPFDKNFVPSYDGWIKLNVRSNSVSIKCILADDAPDMSDARNEYARTQLWYHLNKKSYKIGDKLVARIVFGGPLEFDDGFSYCHPRIKDLLKEGSYFEQDKFVIFKAMGHSNFRGFHKEPSLVIKGLFKICTEEAWNKLCAVYHISDDSVSIITPSVTPKLMPKGVTEDFNVVLDLYFVSRTTFNTAPRLSLQSMTRMPLTAKGIDLCRTLWGKSLERLMSLLETKDQRKIAELVISATKDLIKDPEVHAMDDDDDDVIEHVEDITSTALKMAFLPVKAKYVLDKMLPILFKGQVRKQKVKGIVCTVAPNNALFGNQVLDSHEVILPAICRGMKMEDGTTLSAGSWVTVYRYPNTGIEMAECRVRGFSEYREIQINPQWFASRFSGDVDGDIVGVAFLHGIIDEARVAGAVSSKNKSKEDVTALFGSVKGWWSRLAISTADTIITKFVENGMDTTPARILAQGVIDSIKHKVENTDLIAFQKEWGVDKISNSPAVRFLKGKWDSVALANKLSIRAFNEAMKNPEGNNSKGSLWQYMVIRDFGFEVILPESDDNGPAVYSNAQEADFVLGSERELYNFLRYGNLKEHNRNALRALLRRNGIENADEVLDYAAENRAKVVAVANKMAKRYDDYLMLVRSAYKFTRTPLDQFNKSLYMSAAYTIIRDIKAYCEAEPVISSLAACVLWYATNSFYSKKERFNGMTMEIKNSKGSYTLYKILPLSSHNFFSLLKSKFYFYDIARLASKGKLKPLDFTIRKYKKDE